MSSPPSLSPAHNGPCKSLLSSIHPRPPSAEEFSMTGLSDPARMRRRKSIGGEGEMVGDGGIACCIIFRETSIRLRR